MARNAATIPEPPPNTPASSTATSAASSRTGSSRKRAHRPSPSARPQPRRPRALRAARHLPPAEQPLRKQEQETYKARPRQSSSSPPGTTSSRASTSTARKARAFADLTHQVTDIFSGTDLDLVSTRRLACRLQTTARAPGRTTRPAAQPLRRQTLPARPRLHPQPSARLPGQTHARLRRLRSPPAPDVVRLRRPHDRVLRLPQPHRQTPIRTRGPKPCKRKPGCPTSDGHIV